MELVREKRVMFEKWCLSSKTTTFEELRELILLEDFKSCLPEGVVVHLNERKMTSLLDAAVLADEFVLTHRNVFPSVRSSNIPFANKNVYLRICQKVVEMGTSLPLQVRETNVPAFTALTKGI